MTFEIVRSLSKGQCPHSMADMFFWGYCTPGNNNRGNLSQFNDISPPFRSSNCPAQKMWISCLPTAVITPIYGWVVRVGVTPFIQSYATRVMAGSQKSGQLWVQQSGTTLQFFLSPGFCLGWMWTRRQPQELCKPNHSRTQWTYCMGLSLEVWRRLNKHIDSCQTTAIACSQVDRLLSSGWQCFIRGILEHSAGIWTD